MWTKDEPAEDVVDLDVTLALVDAMWKPQQEPEGSGFVRAGPGEYSAVKDLDGGGPSGARVRIEALPVFLGTGNPIVAPRPYDVETRSDTPQETTVVEALRVAVDKANAGCRRDAAAAAWHADPVVRHFCETFGG